MKNKKEFKRELVTSLSGIILSHLTTINPPAAKASAKGVKTAASAIVKKFIKKSKDTEKTLVSVRKAKKASGKAAPRKAALKKKRSK